MNLHAECSTCHGTGYITVDWGDAPCPGCALRSRYEDRAAEEWKALRDSGADELTLLRASGRD